ncbi:B3 domain-containing transcription factor VRN1-like [Prunus avium]|uniref:B3 domain-containing transcription factor VRN1-like n=1 Tax=Prunus avium TaxID=42229 RepID=A0A6P5SL53_PRUAV|nr:B3 domain-containing transcription factor VRN1-like [Prunus avium]
MAPSPHQKIDHQGPKFRATTPHFFNKIVDKRLRVPKTFLDKYAENLSDQIHLKLPCGSEWKIKLRRCNGEVWFGKGWPEFSEFYSLKKGNSLLFRYEGNSKFHVLIFDESGTEMDYPIAITLIEETDEEDDVKSVESLEYFPTFPKTKHKTGPLLSPLPQEKSRTNPRSSSKPSSSSSSSANEFVSSHPFFKVTLGSYLGMNVPASFRKHFTTMETQIVRLWVGDRSWPVKLIFHRYNGQLSAGWRAFSKENSLKKGDVCIFELIDTNNVALVVNIFRC